MKAVSSSVSSTGMLFNLDKKFSKIISKDSEFPEYSQGSFQASKSQESSQGSFQASKSQESSRRIDSKPCSEREEPDVQCSSQTLSANFSGSLFSVFLYEYVHTEHMVHTKSLLGREVNGRGICW